MRKVNEKNLKKKNTDPLFPVSILFDSDGSFKGVSRDASVDESAVRFSAFRKIYFGSGSRIAERNYQLNHIVECRL